MSSMHEESLRQSKRIYSKVHDNDNSRDNYDLHVEELDGTIHNTSANQQSVA